MLLQARLLEGGTRAKSHSGGFSALGVVEFVAVWLGVFHSTLCKFCRVLLRACFPSALP